ncbi:MAG: transporter substrate-binding domain-containing protein, partial [Coriobacteriales bacterium]|nr:transporter substrate-binding domain-containing protein [Coriobacteriales bacterium]
MRTRQNASHRQSLVTVLALTCALALTGCSNLPFDLPDLPFDIPEFSFELPELPFDLPDLSGLPNPFSRLGTSTSVEDARNAKAKAASSGLTAEDLVSDGVLTVGLLTKQVSAPFVVKGAGSSIYGIDVDVASAVASELGLSVRFVVVEDADKALSEGTCDVVMDVASSHTGDAALVSGYYETAFAFFAKGERRVVTVDELNGKTVAVQDGSVSQAALNRTSLTLEQKPYTNLNECFEALNAGEVDYVICDAYPGAYLAAAYEGMSFVGALTNPATINMAVSKDKAYLQDAMQRACNTVVGGGAMEIIRSTWVGGMEAITDQDVIADVPIREDAPPLDEWGTPQDGSNAGSNAVIITQSMVDEANARAAAEAA